MTAPIAVEEEVKEKRKTKDQQEALKRYESWLKKTKMDDNEASLIEWDRTQNRKRLLDWNEQRNIDRGLWMQAHWILSGRRHIIMDGITGPDVWKNAEGFYESTKEMSAKDVQFMLDNWLSRIRSDYIRLRDAGAKYPQIKDAALATIQAAETEFKKLPSSI